MIPIFRGLRLPLVEAYDMKRVVNFVAGSILITGIAGAQGSPKYSVVDLGTLPGGAFSQATAVNDNRLVTGISADKDGTQQAMLWWAMFRINIGTPGLNSGAFAVNSRGQAAVEAEVASLDPNNENFCAYGTGRKCRPFIWDGGALRELPLLGGNNGSVGSFINNRGEVAGGAETADREPNCPAGVSVSGTGPQILNFKAVVWGPGAGQMRKLTPLPGDTLGMATAINDHGQAVGATGTCANLVLPPLAFGPHAVLWDTDNKAQDLGNLGSTALNIALAINNKTQVVGVSSLYPDSSPFGGSHAFLWQRGVMNDLGTLPGDVQSVAQSINDEGQVTGVSFDGQGNPRPFLWQNGVMQDLNELVVGGPPLLLLFGPFINNNGEIAGFGITDHGDVHAFLASPVAGGSEERRTRPTMPENLRQIIGDGHGWFTLGVRRAR
jgi:probable HAF family extracellular repeat protein